MSSNAYPISAPVEFNGTGAIYFNHTGATNHNLQDTYNFVSAATGALYYVGSGAQVQGLGIGTNGQVLRVNAGGTAPEWYTLASAGPIFSAFSSAAGATFAGSNTWTTLDDTYVTWDTTAPGVDDALNFNPATGEFTVPAGGDGVYELACSVAFTGNNSGTNGLLSDPSGRASRQIQLLRTGDSAVLSVSARQADASNSNSTQVSIHNCKVALAAGDVVVVQARHDANTSLGILGDKRVSFSASRVR